MPMFQQDLTYLLVFLASCFLHFGAFLFFVGVYCSAVTISQDIELRRTIRKIAEKESKALDSMGMAQMEQEVGKLVLRIAKQQQETMTEQTGIESSVDKEDIQEYSKHVISEIKKG
jgi:hypothetical protein